MFSRPGGHSDGFGHAKRPRVLVAEGNPGLRQRMMDALVKSGFKVMAASNGTEAATTFFRWEPDLVVADLCLPHVDGIELCRRVRSTSRTPVIMMGLPGTDRARREALEAGAAAFVFKPFDLAEVVARVKSALAGFPNAG